jgi:hypothetical protein
MYLIIIAIIIYMIFPISAITQTVNIPRGNSVKIDGIMEKEEWGNAINQEFIGGEGILFQHDTEFLYLGIRGEKGGFASVCVLYEDSIYVFHSSMGLITAKYVREESRWLQTLEFRSEIQHKIGKVENTDDKMKLSLKEYGWFANIITHGNTNEIEYKISLKKFKENNTYISIVFFQHAGKIQFAHAPSGLSDGSMNSEMVRGGNVKYLSFNIDSWLYLSW